LSKTIADNTIKKVYGIVADMNTILNEKLDELCKSAGVMYSSSVAEVYDTAQSMYRKSLRRINLPDISRRQEAEKRLRALGILLAFLKKNRALLAASEEVEIDTDVQQRKGGDNAAHDIIGGPESHLPIVESLVEQYSDASAGPDYVKLVETIAKLLPYVLDLTLCGFIKVDFAMEILINGAHIHDVLYRAILGKGGKPSDLFRGHTEKADLHFLKRYLYLRAAERFRAENDDILQQKEEAWECIKGNRPLLETSVLLLSTRQREYIIRVFDMLEQQESMYLVPYIQDCADALLNRN